MEATLFQALAKGMPADQVARMALFFARFRQRFGMTPSEYRAGSRLTQPKPGG